MIIGLRIKEENVALDRFMSNLQGETKIRFESPMRNYGTSKDLLKEMGRFKREYANEIASLIDALNEEHELRVSLEQSLDSLDETNDKIIAKTIKKKYHAIAKYEVF